MSDFIDYFTNSDSECADQLEELRLGADPRVILLFSKDTETVGIHYVDDEAVNGYVICPGKACPICHTGSEATQTALLPVFDLEDQAVKILRVPYSRRTGSLGLALVPHLNDPDISGKLVLLSRKNRTYHVAIRPLQEDADRGDLLIKAFVKRHDAGLTFATAITQMPADALAEVRKIRNKLDAIGGWKPPTKKNKKKR